MSRSPYRSNTLYYLVYTIVKYKRAWNQNLKSSSPAMDTVADLDDGSFSMPSATVAALAGGKGREPEVALQLGIKIQSRPGRRDQAPLEFRQLFGRHGPLPGSTVLKAG